MSLHTLRDSRTISVNARVSHTQYDFRTVAVLPSLPLPMLACIVALVAQLDTCGQLKHFYHTSECCGVPW